MTMHPALIDWALPVSGALGLWLTAEGGEGVSDWVWARFGKSRPGLWLLVHRLLHNRSLRTLGYALGLAGQPIWLIWTYQQMPEVYGPFVTSVLFTLAWARGLWRNWRG